SAFGAGGSSASLGAFGGAFFSGLGGGGSAFFFSTGGGGSFFIVTKFTFCSRFSLSSGTLARAVAKTAKKMIAERSATLNIVPPVHRCLRGFDSSKVFIICGHSCKDTTPLRSNHPAM